MKEKKKKAPGIFKKPVKAKKWEKKYLRKVYLPEDRKFLEKLVVEEDGFIRINTEGLSKKDRDRLKALGKSIKKNRKGVSFILILIIILLAGGIVFFQFYLKNRIVQRLIETNLEKVFLAEVDTDGVNLEIFNGRFSLDYLAIADAGNPMQNLVEFSSVEASIDTAELLQGRGYIEELGFTGMKRATSRDTSGQLEPSGSADQAEAESAGVSETIESVISQITALTGGFDPKQLLEQQKDKLVTLPLIEESVEDVKGYSEHWEGRVDVWSSKIGGWEDTVDYIKRIDANSFSTMESAAATISSLETAYNNAESDYNEIMADYRAAEQQYNEVIAMSAGIQDAVKADYAYVESLVTMPAGQKVQWAASILEEQLAMPFTKYLSYIERGLDWYERFKNFAANRDEKKKERRRPGRSLPPPSDAPAAFTIVHAFAEGEEPDLKYRFDLNNLVSEPEKQQHETSLEIDINTPASGSASALITEEGLSLELPAAPFDLGDSLAALDVASFGGFLSLDTDIGWTGKSFSGKVDLAASELSLQGINAESLLYRLVSASLDAAKPIKAAGDFMWSEAEGLALNLDTNLDEGLGAAVKAIAVEGAEEGLALLEDYLGTQLDGPLKDFDSLQGEFEGYIDRIENYEAELDKYRLMAEDKIAEIEKTVEDNLKKQAESLIKDNLPSEAGNALKDLGGLLKF